MFGGLGAGEIVLILVIALVVFGPSRLPELGKGLGNAIREFKQSTNELREDVLGAGDKPKA